LRKRFYYISHRDMMRGRTDCIGIMQTCHCLAEQGFDVVLVAPFFFRAGNVRGEGVWQHYGLRPSFRFVTLPTPLWDGCPVWWERVVKLLFHLVFALVVAATTLFRPRSNVVVCGRCIIGFLPYVVLLWPVRRWKRIQLMYDLHAFRADSSHQFIMRAADDVACISNGLREGACQVFGLKTEKCFLARVGVDIERYRRKGKKAELRAGLGLPNPGCLAVFTGKVYRDSGEVEMILRAAKLVPDVGFALVGGKDEAVLYWRRKAEALGLKNTVLVGFVPPAKIADYQLAADMLLMYYPSDIPTAQVTSPGKLMEYLATGNLIVSGDLPALREVLRHEQNAITVPPNSPELLADAIRKWAQARGMAVCRIRAAARKEARRWTWAQRAAAFTERTTAFQAARRGQDRRAKGRVGVASTSREPMVDKHTKGH
jgi:glycosyltransferase involved in cell wall biosynthesis